VVWTASYLPFGGVHVTSGAPIDLRFPGQWFQAESGLHQNWMRDYDPTTGRYVEADPLGLVDGASVYGYVRQNPGRYVDPRGECPWCAAAIVGAAGGVMIGYIIDEVWGDGCYEWDEAGRDAAIGAAFGVFNAAGYAGRFGKEWASKSGNWRWAPWGNSSGNQYGKWPHYHRRGAGPGQGVKRHRPWEPKHTDTSWRDLF